MLLDPCHRVLPFSVSSSFPHPGSDLVSQGRGGGDGPLLNSILLPSLLFSSVSLPTFCSARRVGSFYQV